MANLRGRAAIDARLKKNAANQRYLRLAGDGDKAIVAFVGVIQNGSDSEDDAEPYPHETVWVDGSTEDYNSEDHAGYDPKLVFLWNVYNKEIGRVQIWTGNTTFYKRYRKIAEKKGMNFWFEIERDGKAGDTKTRYDLFDLDPIEDDELAKLKEMQLKNLGPSDDDKKDSRRRDRRRESRKEKPRPNGQTSMDSSSEKSSSSSSNGNGATVDEASLKEIRKALKSLPDPMEALNSFTDRFSISKVKELSMSKKDEAIAFLTSMMPGSSSEPKAEVDPFD